MNRGIATLLCAALALIAVEGVLGVTATPVGIARPCAVHPLFAGHGVDAATQRVVLDGLARAGCSLGVTREALVLSFAGSSEHLDRPNARVERAVRHGLVAALDDATRRGEIPALLAIVLRPAIEHAPIDKLISGALL